MHNFDFYTHDDNYAITSKKQKLCTASKKKNYNVVHQFFFTEDNYLIS